MPRVKFEKIKLRTKQIDILNIGLLLFSFILALKLPFDLFIFSYVILGPLHYLTELNWLKKNDYFVNGKKWIWVFILLSLLITLPLLLKLPIIADYGGHLFSDPAKFFKTFFSEIILIMFLFAIGLTCFNKWQDILLSLLASIVSGFIIIKYVPFSFIIAGLFLPSIIHVYLFTLLFMIFGALNTKSKEGIIAIVLLILCPMILSIITIIPSDYSISAYTETSYSTSRFSVLNSHIAKIVSPLEKEKFYFLSEIGIKIQIFIAFCYTYHYLNWFSKTSIIGWSKSLSKRNIIIVVLLWSLSILLYFYDFRVGYIVLFFFSIIHVVLEFPLNIATIKGIINKIKFRLIT